jgi:putative AphA-like transcriptional regulator
MEPADLALLVVLGTADAGPASLEDIAEVARLLAPMDWQPTTDTIRACVERAIAQGLLQPVDSNEADIRTALETTSAGQATIVELLRRPIAQTSGGFIRACMSAKLCFLHHLPLPQRGTESETLAQLYRDAVRLIRRLQRLPRPLAGAALHDLRHEIVCMESELAWLDGMAAWRPQLPQQWAAE